MSYSNKAMDAKMVHKVHMAAKMLDAFQFGYDFYSYIDVVGLEKEERDDAVARLAFDLFDEEKVRDYLDIVLNSYSEDCNDLRHTAIYHLVGLLGNEQDILPVPDDSVTVQEMNEYGYTDGDMYPIRDMEIAERIFREGCAVLYCLGRDNMAEEVRHADGLAPGVYDGALYGVKVSEWNINQVFKYDYMHDKGHEM